MAENIIVPYRRPSRKVENNTIEERGDYLKSCTQRQKNWTRDTDIDLFLLGKTGNGKSATGNSILQRQVFESESSMSSVTTEVNFDYSEFDGRVIKVVDVRGVQDTRETTAKSTALFIRDMEYAIVANPKGYHAFLIVLKYTNRFTQEEVETIRFLKAVFGETFVKDHCIIVMACGDMFLFEHGSDGLSFRTWCDRQQGRFKELLQECSHRLVLFNNKSKDEGEKKKQVVELLNLIDQLNGTRYTDDKFKQANLAQTELIMQSEVDDIREHVLIETSLILQKLKSCQQSLSDEHEALENLLLRTESFMEDLLGLDKKTKLLHDLIEDIGDIKSNISSEIKVHVDIREWRKSFEDYQKNMERKASAKIDKLKKQYLISTVKCSDDDKIRLEKELDEKIEYCEKKLELEKKSKETEFFHEINERREKLKLKRQKQEAKYQEKKLNYIKTFLSKSFDKLVYFFHGIFSRLIPIFGKRSK